MRAKKRRLHEKPADLRVREVIFKNTSGELAQKIDSGETDAAYIRVSLPCRVAVPLGVCVRYPNFEFDGCAVVTMYGKERESGKWIRESERVMRAHKPRRRG